METRIQPPPCGGEQRQRASGTRSVPGGGQTSTSVPEIVSIARTWIGTPYVHQASCKGAGCDCLGLLRGIWRERHGDEPEDVPPYLPDWHAGGGETLRDGFARHLSPISLKDIAPGDVLLFRMVPRAPARHCAILGELNGKPTLIHARQNKRVSEEPFAPFWRRKLAYAFRM